MDWNPTPKFWIPDNDWSYEPICLHFNFLPGMDIYNPLSSSTYWGGFCFYVTKWSTQFTTIHFFIIESIHLHDYVTD